MYLIEGKRPLPASPFAQMQIEFSIEKPTGEPEKNTSSNEDGSPALFPNKPAALIKCYLPYHGEVSLVEPFLSVKVRELESS